jgi:AraC-like DNA-binding protein
MVRLRLGGVHAAYRPFPSQRAVTLTPSDSLIYVILPVLGGVVAVTAEDTHQVGAGEALLLARAERVSCVWHPGSAGLVLHIPRASIQAAAARLSDAPCRLAGIVTVFTWKERPAFLAGPPFDPSLIDNSLRPAESLERQRLLCHSLVQAIEAAGLGRAAFLVAKSVMRALAHVRANPSGAWTVEDLAPIAGVTAATLRKNFRACLGLTVTQVVREARLQWARDQLVSAHESRSIARLAGAAGFGSAGVFARAYQQHFGETPTQTRARAFASA